MKRGLIFLVIFMFLLFSILLNAEILAQITGETVTGKATQSVAMNITVAGPPTLIILFPENKTYLKNTSILLNYSVSVDAQAVWYSLDSEANITITSEIYFNTSQGSHSLYLYANNSYENKTTNVSFFVNLTRFTILYSEYNGTKRGASTEFRNYTYEDIQNLSNIALENTDFGKILFNQNINMTADSNFSDDQIDLDSNTDISSNKIEINSTTLPNFNKIATLWLYSLTFSNPRILIGGEACPSSICQKESYSGGILKFNITSFSGNFSAGETPSTEVTSSNGIGRSGGGGGGGGGIIAKKVESFSINKNEIKSSLTPGSISTEKIIIKNNLNKTINVSLEETDSIKEFLVIEEKKIELKPGESKEILIDFKVRGNILPDLYAGKIVVKGGGTVEEILVVLEVESEGALLDVKVDILKEFLKIYANKEIIAEIKLFNVGEAGNRKDIKVNYIIKDTEGKEIMNEEETVSLETQTSFIKRLTLPKSIKGGKYILYIKATTYEGKVASASTSFEIIKITTKQIYATFILLFIILLGIIISYIIKQRKRLNNKLKGKKISRHHKKS